MASWTLAEARSMLAMWLEAEAAVATGQRYKIGTRELQRADLSDIANRIRFWRREVEQLESGNRGLRVKRVVPRDL